MHKTRTRVPTLPQQPFPTLSPHACLQLISTIWGRGDRAHTQYLHRSSVLGRLRAAEEPEPAELVIHVRDLQHHAVEPRLVHMPKHPLVPAHVVEPLLGNLRVEAVQQAHIVGVDKQVAPPV